MPMRRLVAILAAAAALAFAGAGMGVAPGAAQVVCAPADAETAANSGSLGDFDPADPAAARRGGVVGSWGSEAATRCTNSDGAAVTPHVNAAGDLSIRDEDGNTVYGQTNAFGTTTVLPPPESYAPPRYQATPDGAGGAIFRDDAGGAISAPVDPQGNSTFNDGRGHVRRCWTDPTGKTYCD